ncbi:MAG TPA: glycosyltransferase [Acidobacteriota bacterium]|jgi:glycosyltransferase involved in cell wall biosynthesis
MTKKTLEKLYAEHVGKVSDKWSLYFNEYDRILDEYRNKPVRLLEIGIQNGGSLEIWSKYFPYAQKLVGCDINPDCAGLSYEDPRIAVVVGDANSDAAQAAVLGHAPGFDVIIDDGSHRSSDIVKTFARYFPHLSDGGVFIVEDLHCSYWQEFEGGLFDPFSSITFFKRLADVVSHEHWGIEKARADILSGFFAKYGSQIDEDALQHVHSVEFINSMCVICRAKPERNRLGRRVIGGSVEMIAPGHLEVQGWQYRPAPAAYDQTGNVWTARSMPPDEELLFRIKELAERDGQITSLNQAVAERDGQITSLNQVVIERDGQIASVNQAVAERDGQIAGLNQAVAERDGQIAGLYREIESYTSSKSWRFTKPLRLIGREIRSIKSGAKTILMSPRLNDQGSRRLFKEKLRRAWIQTGHSFYRRWLKGTQLGHLIKHESIERGYITPAEIQNCTLTQTRSEEEESFVNTVSEMPGLISAPLNLVLSDTLAMRPHIDVLLPSLRVEDMSGGPNTALLLAGHLAETGESVRLVATGVSTGGKEVAIYSHMDRLLQRQVDRGRITLVDGSDRSNPIMVGANDLFLATAWWTAQMAKDGMQKTNYDKFIYLIQDFEPILHEGSTYQALALDTYGLPHIPVVNSKLLRDHLIKEGCGRYSQQGFAEDALFFEPAIDRSHFFPDVHKKQDPGVPKRRVLLFYARPTRARRNLFEIGVLALRRAVAAGLLEKDTWEIWGMGEQFDAVPLGNDVFLDPLPWMSFDGYAERVRTADLLLSLMFSPHPSYPPLEMAASGKLVVTNSFSVKTAERMRALSPNILVAAPNPDSVAAVLQNAVGRINAGLPSYDPFGTIDLPSNWDESLGGIVPTLKKRIDTLRKSPSRHPKFLSNGYPVKAKSEYECFRKRRLSERRRQGHYCQDPGLLSFLTPVFNTEAKYLEELAGSIFLQDGGTNFEWLILDNGSTNESTRATLRTIAKHRCVRLERVEKPLGIIGGTRYCLERATGRYILPLDHDDIVEPDCVHVLTRFVREAGFPALLYTDEDKVADDGFVSPYFKPGWDPVLFVHSCYIAHLCAMDREKALALNLYSDRGAEGCPDWDSFIRFINAGYVPHHIPEVLYSWRMHGQSTSENINSKSYISDSHRVTLQRFLDRANAPHIELIPSPFFSQNVDWWFRRKRCNPAPYLSIFIGREPTASVTGDIPQQIPVSLKPSEGISRLAEILGQRGGELVHICWDGITPDTDEWFWEAMGLIELFPDTVMVGGTLHNGSKVLDGPRIFGFGEGFECPDLGQLLSDPGYFAKMWKPHSVSAISTGHCVVRYSFLVDALPELIQAQVPLGMLGPWLGALAREASKRVVFSPFMRALAQAVPEDCASPESRAHFLSRFWHLLPDEQLLSPRLSLNSASAYTPVADTEREQHLERLRLGMLAYPDWFNLEIQRRANRYPLPNKVATLSIITTVYEGTDILLLDALADSITKQTLPAAQWVIVAHGPISGDDLGRIRKKAEVWGATLVVEPHSLGIMGAMRRGLEHAQGQYIVPVDADDVLTIDALQILIHEIDRLDRPDLLYSDEDSLVDGTVTAPYLRGTFDPVLNLESSYIWHLCAINRESAVEFELYTDAEATWCHDWDSVMRITNAGGRIEHVGEILYHWRQHPSSTTNQSVGDPRSLESVRHVLEQQTRRTPYPERYTVESWPLYRGMRELYIARKEVALPEFVWVGDVLRGALGGKPSNDTVLVVTSGDLTIENEAVYGEVARLFELHPSVAAVGGRVLDPDDRIVEGCVVINQAGAFESPWEGRNAVDPGPYALALKPQSVDGVGPSLAFFRLQALREIGCSLPDESTVLSSWVADVCDRINEANWKIAFSPLVYARTTKAWPVTRQFRQPARLSSQTSNHAIARYGRFCPHDYN